MPDEALAKAGYFDMHYVYLIKSEKFPDQKYIGVTDDLKKRMKSHNAGGSKHTLKYKPWKLITYIAFDDQQKSKEFEHYLKSGSGHAFANKRLW